MPIPGIAPGTPSTPVTSSDGVLTLTPDAVFPAAAVKVDFSVVSGTSAAVFVTVSRADGPVRGFDTRFAPRGIAAGYDAEAPLGSSASWVARCFNAAGTLLATSGAVSLTLPRPRVMWLVCLSRPGVSVGLIAEQYPSWQRARPVGALWAIGGKFPSVSAGVRRSGVGSLSVHTQDVSQRDRMLALLDAADPVWLLRPDAVSAAVGATDTFVAVGDADEGWDVQNAAWRTWSLPLTQAARPMTAGSIVAVPGGTFAEAAAVPVSSLPAGRIVDYIGS